MGNIVDSLQKWILKLAPYPALALVLVSLAGIFFWVPTDAGLGLSQRIFYYHVPAATSCFLAFAGGGIASALYLYTRRPWWDHAAHAAVSVGMLFATIVLCTGMIWARTAWGAWWTWDSRLTTFLILWLVYASYLLLRTLTRDNDMGPRYAAVLCIVGALNVPLVMMATRLFRTIHPQVINNPQGGIKDGSMIATLMLSMGAEITLMVWLWALTVSTLRLRDRVELLSEESYRRSVPS